MWCILPTRKVRETRSGNLIITVAECKVCLFCVYTVERLAKMPARLSSSWNSDPVSLYIRNHNVVSVTRMNITKISVIKMSSPTLKVVKPVFPMRG